MNRLRDVLRQKIRKVANSPSRRFVAFFHAILAISTRSDGDRRFRQTFRSRRSIVVRPASNDREWTFRNDLGAALKIDITGRFTVVVNFNVERDENNNRNGRVWYAS